MKKNKLCRWTKEENKKMLDMYQDGSTDEQIGVVVGRTANAVKLHREAVASTLDNLGIDPEYIAQITGTGRKNIICVLLCESGKYYIGRTSKGTKNHIIEYFTQQDVEWTKKYPPLSIIEMDEICGDLDENIYISKYALKYGAENVKGSCSTLSLCSTITPPMAPAQASVPHNYYNQLPAYPIYSYPAYSTTPTTISTTYSYNTPSLLPQHWAPNNYYRYP
jgi:hypothetical protein